MLKVENSEFQNYDKEVEEKYQNTVAYREYQEKAKTYSKTKQEELSNQMNTIFKEFSNCLSKGDAYNSLNVQILVKKLQNHICENYYTCTNEILLGLSQIYVNDERFKNNIDKNLIGTAEFVVSAISYYVKDKKEL